MNIERYQRFHRLNFRTPATLSTTGEGVVQPAAVYLSFIPEVQAISRDAITNGVAMSRHQFADDFTKRDDFRAAYDNLSNDDYVDTLYRNAGVNPDRPTRDRQVDDLNNNRRKRGDVLQDVAEHPELHSREYNGAFVLMQYFGYLRRDPDEAGYQFWVGKLNLGTHDNYPSMVNAFVKALEYRDRFGAQLSFEALAPGESAGSLEAECLTSLRLYFYVAMESVIGEAEISAGTKRTWRIRSAR